MPVIGWLTLVPDIMLIEKIENITRVLGLFDILTVSPNDEIVFGVESHIVGIK